MPPWSWSHPQWHPTVWLLCAVLLCGYYLALDYIGPRRVQPGEPVATRAQRRNAILAAVDAMRADGNGNEGKSGLKDLQEGKLDFECVLGPMSFRIFGEQIEFCDQLRRERAVDLRVAQRRLPRAARHDGQSLAASGMVGAENDEALGKLHAREDRASHVTGIHVSGMWHHAAKRR